MMLACGEARAPWPGILCLGGPWGRVASELDRGAAAPSRSMKTLVLPLRSRVEPNNISGIYSRQPSVPIPQPTIPTTFEIPHSIPQIPPISSSLSS